MTRIRNARSELGDTVVDMALSSSRRALADSSLVTYGSGLKCFNDFCERMSIPVEKRMPASEFLLAAWLNNISGAYSSNTIDSYLSGVHRWHSVHGAPWQGNNQLVKDAKKTASKEGTHLKRDPRPPVTRDHLTALLRALNLSNHRDAALWAIATCTFFGCRRLGETTITEKFEPSRHVMKNVVISWLTLGDGSRSASFHIPWTKSTQEAGGDITLTSRSDLLCPVRALENHLRINKAVAGHNPLFSFIDDTAACFYRKKIFLADIASIWEPLNFPAIYGHSFRIGGAVELLLSGVPPEVVAATGGWRSIGSFMLYWREVKHIVTLFTSDAYSKQHLKRLTSQMNTLEAQSFAT